MAARVRAGPVVGRPGSARAGQQRLAGGPVNGAGEGNPGADAIAPPRNLHSTTISAGMARPAALTMKSMGNTTGLEPGAGVDAPCRFPVTLSAHAGTKSPRRPAGALTHPSPCCRSPSRPPLTAMMRPAPTGARQSRLRRLELGSLARRQHAHLDRRSSLADSSANRLRRPRRIADAPRRPRKRERPPMDRDRDPRTRSSPPPAPPARDRGGPRRRRAPAPDRQQRHVERRRDPPSRRTGRCRRRSRRCGSRARRSRWGRPPARTVAAADRVPPVSRPPSPRRSRAPRPLRAHEHRVNPARRNHAAAGRGASSGPRALQPAERRHVGVVGVQVGEQHARRPARGAPTGAAIRTSGPTLPRRTGSVSTRTPSSSSSTVACPSHVTDAGCGGGSISEILNAAARGRHPPNRMKRRGGHTRYSRRVDEAQDPAYGEVVNWSPQAPRFRPLSFALHWLVSAVAVFVAAAIVPHVTVQTAPRRVRRGRADRGAERRAAAAGGRAAAAVHAGARLPRRADAGPA